MRTFLFARATAAIFGCRRLSRLVNHPWVLSTLFLAAKMAEPVWPDASFEELIRISYWDRMQF